MDDPRRTPYPAAAAAWLVGERRARVLDLGSGRGSFAAMLHDQGHQVFGLDRDVAAAAGLAALVGTRLHVAGQVESLPFLSGHFDVVTASQTLHRFARAGEEHLRRRALLRHYAAGGSERSARRGSSSRRR